MTTKRDKQTHRALPDARTYAGLIAAVLLTSLVGGELLYAQEVEPNDTLATAMNTGLMGFGSVTVSDAFLGNGDWAELDVDLYSFEIDDATPLPVFLTVDVERNESALDGFLRIFDASGVELSNNDDLAFENINPRVRTYLLEAGMYYMGVSTSGNPHYDDDAAGSGMTGTTGGYTLTITTEAGALADSPFEPNDGAWTASPMGSGSFSVTGEFIGDGALGRRDVDAYVLTLIGAARIDVEIRAATIGSVLDPAVLLRLCRDARSQPNRTGDCALAERDDAPDGSVDPTFSLAVAEPSDVYLLVSGAGNRRYAWPDGAGGEDGSVGYYDLVVNVTYLDAGGEGEPNDSIMTATSSGLTGSGDTVVIEGVMGDGPYAQTRGDRDFYAVHLGESGVVTIDVAAESIGSGLDPVVAVYDDAGNRIAVSDNHGNSTDAHLVTGAPCTDGFGAGGVYVMVMGTKQRFPNDPFVPIPGENRIDEHVVGDGPGSTGPYELTMSVHTSSWSEPNDTLETANETGIVDEGAYAGAGAEIGDGTCPDPGRDVDMWRINVVETPALLRVTGIICDVANQRSFGHFRVFDADGYEVAASPQGHQWIPYTFRVLLDEAGPYYLGASVRGNDSYDPQVPCSGTSGPFYDSYDLIIELTHAVRQRSSVRGREGGGREAVGDPAPLFATRLDEASRTIDVLDPLSGEVMGNLGAPQPRFSGNEGLAYDGTHVYYVGVGRFPTLYRLDPSSGAVLDELILWSGSGFYSDAVMLGGELYLLDYYDRSIHVLDPVAQRYRRTLEVGWVSGVTIGGGLAALSGPNRLYVADAFNTGAIYEVHPQRAAVLRTLYAPTNRPTALAGVGGSLLYVADWQGASTGQEGNTLEVIDRTGASVDSLTLDNPVGTLAGEASIGPFADFNSDGAVDLIDVAALQRCFTGAGGAIQPDCGPGDLDGDERIDLNDYAAFPATMTGP